MTDVGDVSARADEEGPYATPPILLSATRTSRAMQARLLALGAPLTLRQWRLLLRIHEGYDSPVRLGRYMGLTAPTISESVDTLVRRDLLTRRRSSTDRRRIVLELTAAGVQALQQANDETRRLAEDFESRLPEHLRPHARDVCAALATIANDELGGASPAGRPFPE